MIGLVYLVWGPLGPDPLRSFLDSYAHHEAGVEHELLIALNGVDRLSPGPREALERELADSGHRTISLDQPVLDLAAYGLAARQTQHSRLCFLNSYSVVLADGWLACLSRALDQPDVSIAGASASWESQAEWIRGKAKFWPYQLLGLRRARIDYPRFPNPHIRTTGFMLARETLQGFKLEQAVDKRATYLLESGHDSITRQVLAGGRRVVVVGRDGRIRDVEEWPDSHTYRSGEQENLLVADRRTEDWRHASSRLRRRLSRDAWGSRAL